MPYIDNAHTRKGEPRFHVRWRTGGGRAGKPDSETFATIARAELFASLVKAAGEHRPSNQQLIAFGLSELATDEAPAVSPTVVAYCLAYIDGLGTAKPRQISDYRAYVRRHIEPFFGDRLLTDVDRADMRQWQRWALNNGGKGGKSLSGNSVAKVRAAVLYPAMAAACRRQDDGSPGLRSWNPFEDLAAPDVVRNPHAVLYTDDDARYLLRGAYMVDEFIGDSVALLLASAARWGELFGLCRPAVITAKRFFEIRSTAADVDGHGRYVLKPEPKSEAGWRRIDYPDCVAALVARRTLAAGGPHGLLFAPGRGSTGVMSHTNYLRRYKQAIRNAAALGLERTDVTPHGLRASTLTQLGEAAVPEAALQTFAGHEHRATTAGYVRDRGTGGAAIAAALDGWLAGVVAGTPAAA